MERLEQEQQPNLEDVSSVVTGVEYSIHLLIALVEQLFVSYHTVLCNNVGPYHACCPVINVVIFAGITFRLGAYYSQSDKSISLSSSSGYGHCEEGRTSSERAM